MPAAIRAVAFERKLKAGEALFRLGDKAAGFYEVVSGRVRLVRVDRVGRETVLHIAGPAETLAEASLFSGQYHCDAVASSDATVRVYPKRQVVSVFEKDPKALKTFTAMLAHQVMSLRTRLQQRNIRSARERVRQFLALNIGPDGRSVELHGTLKDLAAEIGLTHEALYRALAALERAGEIKRAGNKIMLLKRV
ncbi:MAG TPA: Crp/Fnr family transcriptional regulator [Pseudolabrys sp.]|nr:Crp/Fnr family transcriptional regulator [Pseudolabrys sp.]